MPLMEIRGLTHTYSAGTPFEKVAVDHLDLDIEAGQTIGLIGHTGSGKSTLIQHMNALLKPDSGTVLLQGQDIFASKETMYKTRFRVGLVFQYPEYQLFEETVYKDIAFGPKNMKLSEKEVDERVKEAARFVGLTEDLMERSPLELSGGQKRRIAIAGVMAMEPDVLVLDEPIAGLDPAGCRSILKNIADYHRSTGSTVVLVTHDMDVAASEAERLIVMKGGSVALSGTPEEIFARPEELRSMGLDIPGLLSIANDMAVAKSFNVVSRYTILGEDKQASACIGCGQCETVCPQKIPVPEEMNRLAALMSGQKTWEEICAERAAIAEAAKQGK